MQQRPPTFWDGVYIMMSLTRPHTLIFIECLYMNYRNYPILNQNRHYILSSFFSVFNYLLRYFVIIVATMNASLSKSCLGPTYPGRYDKCYLRLLSSVLVIMSSNDSWKTYSVCLFFSSSFSFSSFLRDFSLQNS